MFIYFGNSPERSMPPATEFEQTFSNMEAKAKASDAKKTPARAPEEP